MKQRMGNKSEKQKSLDRKLIEQIGDPDQNPTINLFEIFEIKMLVKQVRVSNNLYTVCSSLDENFD